MKYPYEESVAKTLGAERAILDEGIDLIAFQINFNRDLSEIFENQKPYKHKRHNAFIEEQKPRIER